VNWGFWEQTANLSPALRAIGPGIIPAGMRSFSTAQGLAALAHLLEQGAVNTAVMPVDLQAWQRHHPSASQSSLLANLRSTETSPLAAPTHADLSDASPRGTMQAASSEARRQLAEDYLRQQIGRVLRMAPERLDANQSLNNLGIDSLMAVELRNHVQAHLGVMIPLAKLLQDPTIAQLGEVILQQFGDSPPAAAGSGVSTSGTSQSSLAINSPGLQQAPSSTHAQADPAIDATHAALEKIDELTDEQVDAMLRQMLTEEQQQA
jgi:myxalamid-type polyketide synthase MxaE and MxaD